MVTTILQSDIAVNFIYPFLLIFFVVFAILEKTKLLGEGKGQINALVAGVIALIFIAAVTPKLIVGNLVLFLSVAMIIVFVVLLLWGFVSGGEMKGDILKSKGLKAVVAIVILVSVFLVVSLSAGIDLGGFFNKLFYSSWSSSLWTNVLFVVLIAIAIAVAVMGGKSSGGK